MSDALLTPEIPTRQATSAPRRRRAGIRAGGYLAPLVVVLVVWVYGPLIFTAVLSLLDWNLISSQSHWRGLSNYTHLFAQPEFRQAALNTLWYALAVLPFATVVPCALAIALWLRPGRRSEIYRTLLFVPIVLAPVANALAWQFILDPLQGAVNQVTGVVGLASHDWLGSSSSALPTIVIVTASKIIALNVLLFGAALAPLNRRTIEAARLDGARSWEITRWIILPHLRRTVVLLGLLSLVVVWPWLFTNIAVLTQGGPNGATSNVYYQLYTYAFTFYDAGTASAAAVVITAGLAALLGVYALVSRRSDRAR